MILPLVEIQFFHLMWALMFMFWIGVLAPDTKENRTFTKVMGVILGITGILMLGIWIGQR